MIALVGIGNLAKEIALRLNEYSPKLVSYVYDDLSLKIKGNMEDYEKSFNEVLDVSDIDRVYCLVEGYAAISGITLKLLKNFEDKPVTIFYLTKDSLSKEERVNNNICINVLQEYTRSKVFEHMFIVNHEILWDGIVSSEQAEDKSMNDLRIMLFDKICFSVYQYQQIRHETPIDGAILNFDDTIYRISTFFDVTSDDRAVLYYPLKYARTYSYILNLPEKLTREDLALMRTLKSKAKDASGNYDVYVSVFEDPKRAIIGFCSTNVIQESKYI